MFRPRAARYFNFFYVSALDQSVQILILYITRKQHQPAMESCVWANLPSTANNNAACGAKSVSANHRPTTSLRSYCFCLVLSPFLQRHTPECITCPGQPLFPSLVWRLRYSRAWKNRECIGRSLCACPAPLQKRHYSHHRSWVTFQVRVLNPISSMRVKSATGSRSCSSFP